MNRNHRPDPRTAALAVALLLLAFALRLYQLDGRPLWWDEGLTLTFSRLGPIENARFAAQTADVNPPVYRWAVGAVTALTGTTPFTTRLVGVYAATVAAAAAFALSRRLTGARAGLWTLTLCAVAPMHVYYAQEAKGYAFTAAAILVAALLWLESHRSLTAGRPHVGAWRLWAGFGLTVTLALGANYLAIVMVGVLLLASAAVTWRARRQGVAAAVLSTLWRRQLAALVGGGLLLLPYPAATLASTADGLASTSADVSQRAPLEYLATFLLVFGGGERAAEPWRWALTAILLTLAIVGAVVTLRRQPAAAGFWLLWLLLPLGLGFIFQLRFAWFFPRFLLAAQVGLLALAGCGLAVVQPWVQLRTRLSAALAALLLLGLLLAPAAPLLATHYRAPALFAEDDDWRLLYADLARRTRPDDMLIARLPWMPGYLYAYVPPERQPAWRLGFFAAETLADEMAQLLATSDRLWQVDYGGNPFDPPEDTIRWLHGRAAVAHTASAGPGTITLFVDRERLPGPAGDTVVGCFGATLCVTASAPPPPAAPGDVVGSRLTWRPTASTPARLVRFLHLYDAQGNLVAQMDGEPVMGSAPTFTWSAGATIEDPVAVQLPADIGRGTYTLAIGLYDRDTLERWSIGTADRLIVGAITVAAH